MQEGYEHTDDRQFRQNLETAQWLHEHTLPDAHTLISSSTHVLMMLTQ